MRPCDHRQVDIMGNGRSAFARTGGFKTGIYLIMIAAHGRCIIWLADCVVDGVMAGNGRAAAHGHYAASHCVTGRSRWVYVENGRDRRCHFVRHVPGRIFYLGVNGLGLWLVG